MKLVSIDADYFDKPWGESGPAAGPFAYPLAKTNSYVVYTFPKRYANVKKELTSAEVIYEEELEQKLFLRASGRSVRSPEGDPIRLIGFGFSNQVWTGSELPTTHHSEVDYQRVREMGMNAVRFYLNYGFFESDGRPFQYKAEAWKWLDENIEWAKKNNIYLVLNMHIPQGGLQSLGDGDKLWQDGANRDRLIALWKAIAYRYGDEPTIAGYSLLNEPVPLESVKQWEVLAQKIVHEIRVADKNHIIFVERAPYIKSTAPENENLNFPSIKDDNIVYEFRVFQPYEFTHQSFSWAGVKKNGKYPNEDMTQYADESPGANHENAQIYHRNKTFLEAIMERYVKWGQDKQVPVFLSEFGTGAPSFQDGRGGLEWVSDMLDLARKYDLGYFYHAYHEDAFGIYFGENLPDPTHSNEALIELFKEKR